MSFSRFCLIILLSLSGLSGCQSISQPETDAQPIHHQTWDSLLKAHVKESGLVDYRGFMADTQQLNAYLTKLEHHHPNDEHWSRNEQLAYWLNAYNAFTIKLILKHYPVSSIKSIVTGPSIPFVHSPWDIAFINIEGQSYDLNNIEHGIIREHFQEPRIHFAVNCASISCPALRPEAYQADQLNQQLNEQAHLFINNPAKNKLGEEKVRISKLFRWYSGDFEREGRTLIDYLNKYSDVSIKSNAEIDYMGYNWKLNAVHAPKVSRE